MSVYYKRLVDSLADLYEVIGKKAGACKDDSETDVVADAAPQRTGVVPTGFPSVDEVLVGGLRTGTLTVLVGEGGVGVSSLVSNIAVNAAFAGCRSLLLTHTEYVLANERILASVARVGVDDFERAAFRDESWPNILCATNDLSYLDMSVGPMSSSVDELMDSITHFVSAGDGDSSSLIVVDGFDDVSDGDGLIFGLKDLAARRNVAVLLTAHFPPSLFGPRAGIDRRIRLEHLYRDDSLMQLVQRADVVLGLYPCMSRRSWSYSVALYKNRHTATSPVVSEVSLVFINGSAKFVEVDDRPTGDSD